MRLGTSHELLHRRAGLSVWDSNKEHQLLWLHQQGPSQVTTRDHLADRTLPRAEKAPLQVSVLPRASPRMEFMATSPSVWFKSNNICTQHRKPRWLQKFRFTSMLKFAYLLQQREVNCCRSKNLESENGQKFLTNILGFQRKKWVV